MSMLDSFFGGSSGSFKAAKCKTLLKLTLPRIKLLRNRREAQLKIMRREIAKLLENGQEATARIRVEHIIREENMMAAQEIIELFCELITVRLPIIETQKECPLDLKEAISSICFAAPRCADLPELLQVQALFAAKYGKEFVAAASELMPNCGVNRQIIELLSIRAPSVEAKMKLLKEIAEEHELNWDPSATESEFLKPHEDLLNGPAFFNGMPTPMPLPKEKPEPPPAPSIIHGSHEDAAEPDDDDFDSLDLPEVPKSTVVQPAPVAPRAPDTTLQAHNEPLPPPPPRVAPEFQPGPLDSTLPSLSVEKQQFIPFSSPPPPFRPAELPSLTKKSEQIFPTATFHPDSVPLSSSDRSAPLSHVSSAENVDLQDVLSAARTAAEAAERAASAARAAADLAQVRISDLASKKSSPVSGNPYYDIKTVDRMGSGHQDDIDSNEFPADHDVRFATYDDHATEHESHAPQRMPSLEDDPIFSYPNLFGSQASKSSPGY